MTDYAPAGWAVPTQFDLDVPSGGKVLVRKLGMEDIIELGMVDKLDVFGAIAGKGPKKPQDHKKKKKDSDNELLEIFRGKGNFNKMMDMINLLVKHSIIKPQVFSKPEDVIDPDTGEAFPAERVEGRFYVDQIPFTDRMFIFNEVIGKELGGDGMEDFREESEQNLGTLAEVTGDELPAESTAANSEPSESVLSG